MFRTIYILYSIEIDKYYFKYSIININNYSNPIAVSYSFKRHNVFLFFNHFYFDQIKNN